MKTFILAVIVLFSLNLQAQTWRKSVNANFNWTAIAESVEGDVVFQKNHHALSAGLQVYINQYPDFEEGSFRHVGYAEDWYNHLGVNISYRYFILKETRAVNPFLFVQSQLSHLNFQKPAIDGTGYDGRGVDLTEPYWITENVIGLGFDFQLWKDLYIFQAAGYGYEWFFGDDNYTLGITGDWAYTLKLGLLYRFD
jgi:hypothetical protein